VNCRWAKWKLKRRSNRHSVSVGKTVFSKSGRPGPKEAVLRLTKTDKTSDGRTEDRTLALSITRARNESLSLSHRINSQGLLTDMEWKRFIHYSIPWERFKCLYWQLFSVLDISWHEVSTFPLLASTQFSKVLCNQYFRFKIKHFLSYL